MFQIRDRILDYLVARSFRVKSALATVGFVLLYVSSWVRRARPIIGAGMALVGFLLEVLILYLVYRQTSRMKNDIEAAERRIMQTRKTVTEAEDAVNTAQSEIQETKQEIEDAKERTFEFVSQTSSMNTLESRLEEVEREVGTGRQTSVRGGLERRVSRLEEAVEGVNRRF